MIETPKTKREARRAALLLLLTCLSAAALDLDARAQQAAAPTTVRDSVQVIPAPKSLSASGENFPLARGARVL